MSDTQCFLCGRRPADAAAPLVVVLRKDKGATATQSVFERLEVPVPACAACGARERGLRKRIDLAKLLAPAAGAVLGWFAGARVDARAACALICGGLGWFVSFVVAAVMENGLRARKHPQVLERLKAGWHFYTPN